MTDKNDGVKLSQRAFLELFTERIDDKINDLTDAFNEVRKDVKDIREVDLPQQRTQIALLKRDTKIRASVTGGVSGGLLAIIHFVYNYFKH